MFIQTEQTPNPATLKFIPGEPVMESGTADFKNAESAARSPLAEHLFAIEGVEGVFFGSDFVSVTKGNDKEWDVLKPSILGVIMEHYTSDLPLFTQAQGDGAAAQAGGESAQEPSGEDGEIIIQIKELLETRVRPAVAQDGGDIIYHGFEEGIVYLQMQGACAGCPSSTATLKSGIENMLRHYIPEVVEVRQVM